MLLPPRTGKFVVGDARERAQALQQPGNASLEVFQENGGKENNSHMAIVGWQECVFPSLSLSLA